MSDPIDEFGFRLNRRRARHRGLLFNRLAAQAARIDPVRDNEVIAHFADLARPE